jgi:NTE family protein
MDISLALGGGGSRGYAHIGVLRCLEREGFRIRALAGTSAGGIVAVGYAAGFTPDKMEAAFSKVDQSKLFARSAEEGPSILGLSGAARLFEEYFGELTFKDLHLPCAVVAVDLKAGQEVVLKEGKVVDALLATVAVPGVFPPKQFRDSQLVDGAVLNPVPVSVARSLAPKLPVVAVVLGGLEESSRLGESHNRFNSIPLPVPVPALLVERFTRTRVAQAFNIFLQSVDVGSRKMAELRLLTDNPDAIIRPNVSGIGLLDKVNVHEIILKGEMATDDILSQLQQDLAWLNRLRRRLFQVR